MKISNHFSVFPFVVLLFISFVINAQNSPPTFEYVIANWETGSQHLSIEYSFTDVENDDAEVILLISENSGESYTVPTDQATGDIGFPVEPNETRQILWPVDTFVNLFELKIRLVVDDRNVADIQDIVDQVDSNRLRSYLESIEGVRHFLGGTTKWEETKDFIQNEFEQKGLQVTRQEINRFSQIGHNIIGRKAGYAEPGKTYIIDGHFDTTGDSPGADDNGSAVAGVLEALQVLSDFNFKNTINFIGFDFEESAGAIGTWGSFQYLENEIKSYETIEGVLNFEMIGYYTNKKHSQQVPAGFDLLYPAQYASVESDSFRGNFITNAGDLESLELNDAFDSAAARYVPELKVISLDLPNDGLIAPDFRRSDHARFWDEDIPALMLTDGADFRNPNYHTPQDVSDSLNFTFMANVVKAAVATLAEIAGLQNSDVWEGEIWPTFIPSNNLDCTLQIFPSPVYSYLTFSLGDCFNQNFSCEIFAMDGKSVFFKEIDHSMNLNYTISLKWIESGQYILLLSDGKNCLSKKFVVKE